MGNSHVFPKAYQRQEEMELFLSGRAENVAPRLRRKQ
ncbi:hypothetical protein, partial [Streptococcus pluranimalium]